ncbi:hypothetical protein, conserved [Babesia ovata]|uniref:Uncharacterized protein n=1 Tax=Babesia ovata TaxID=189622 RepID=A0A2H6KB61_9APIC|nr:uncharacterized protein BOVATA_017240 [Babesia ovata]GBE60231.1 hypothetical protein, conserved [Babesia ovata]
MPRFSKLLSAQHMMEIDPTVVQIYVLYSTSKHSMPPPRSGVPCSVYASLMDWIINNRRNEHATYSDTSIAEGKKPPEVALEHVWTPGSGLGNFNLLYPEADAMKGNSAVQSNKLKVHSSIEKCADAFSSLRKPTPSLSLADQLYLRWKARTKLDAYTKDKSSRIPIRNAVEGAQKEIPTQSNDVKETGRDREHATSNIEGAGQLVRDPSEAGMRTVPNIDSASLEEMPRLDSGNGYNVDSDASASMGSISIPAIKVTCAPTESDGTCGTSVEEQHERDIVHNIPSVGPSASATGIDVALGHGPDPAGDISAIPKKPCGNTRAAVLPDVVVGASNTRRNLVEVERDSSTKNVRTSAKDNNRSKIPVPTPRASVRRVPVASGHADVQLDKPVHGTSNSQVESEHAVVDKESPHVEPPPNNGAISIRHESAVSVGGSETSPVAGGAAVGRLTSNAHRTTPLWGSVVQLNTVVDSFDRDIWMRKPVVRRRRTKSESKADGSSGSTSLAADNTASSAEAHSYDDIVRSSARAETSKSPFVECDDESFDSRSASSDIDMSSRRFLRVPTSDVYDDHLNEGVPVDTLVNDGDVYIDQSSTQVYGEGASVYEQDRDITTPAAYNSELVRGISSCDSLPSTAAHSSLESLVSGNRDLVTPSSPQATLGITPSSSPNPINNVADSNQTVSRSLDSYSAAMHESVLTSQPSKSDNYSSAVGPPPSCALCLSDVSSVWCDEVGNSAMNRGRYSDYRRLRNPRRYLCGSRSCEVLDDIISGYDVSEPFQTYSSRRFESWAHSVKDMLRELGGIEHFHEDGYPYDTDDGLVADIVDWHDMGPYCTFFPPKLVLQTSRDFLKAEFEASDLGGVNVTHRELGGWFEPQAMVVLRSRNTINRDAGWALSTNPEGEENVDVELVPDEVRHVDASVDQEDAYLDATSSTTPTRHPLWYYVYMKTGFNIGASMRSSTYHKLLNAYEVYTEQTKRNFGGDDPTFESNSTAIADVMRRNKAASSHPPTADSLDAISVFQQAYSNMLAGLEGLHSGLIIHDTSLYVSRRDRIFNIIVTWSCLAVLITIISLVSLVSIQLNERTKRFSSTGN